MINDSPLHHQKATHLKDYFPKHFYREDKPRLLPIKELTKEEKIKVTNYLKSITETIEISSMSRD